MNLGNSFFGSHPNAERFAASPGSLISNLLPNILILAGIILLILIMGSGFALISGSNSGNPQAAAKAKNALFSTIIGFLIVVAAYFILQIVGYSTGVNFLNLNL